MSGLGWSGALLFTFALPLGIFSACSPFSLAQAHLSDPVRTFTIDNDRFYKDGESFQIYSGSIHYFRVHPAYWRDRLTRMKALGLNAVTFYVPWNFHEPYPGQYKFEGMADLTSFLDIVKELDFVALVRPGPYICAEWDFGGFPWWFSSSMVQGARTMKLRTNDPDYIRLVDRWWNVLLPKLKPYLYEHGGPIVMVQVENEYGFCQLHDVPYLRHLVSLVRDSLGSNVIVYTTDPPNKIKWGTIKGSEVYSVVDFGPKWFQVGDAFAIQREQNEPSKSPPFVSEYYPGWLTHWSEAIANTSVTPFLETFHDIMTYRNNSGSVNFYMAHGGTNFGYWSGAGIDNTTYMATITSYDYDTFIGEAGGYDQPGVGGNGNKFQLTRKAIMKLQDLASKDMPAVPANPHIVPYGPLDLTDSIGLFKALGTLYPGDGITAKYPDIMEEYGQSGGLILYRTFVPAEKVHNTVLDLTEPVRDYATVLINGKVVGYFDRSHTAKSTLNYVADKQSSTVMLDILVHALGRVNFGCVWDWKGLASPNVTLDGELLEGWHVYPMQLDDPSQLDLDFKATVPKTLENLKKAGQSEDDATTLRSSETPLKVSQAGPVFYRGSINIDASGENMVDGHLADTYLSMDGWGKGLAWINGFNLGWYWPTAGPQVTYYIPGPLLNPGKNTLILLELEESPKKPRVSFVKSPDFSGGPQGAQSKVQQTGEASTEGQGEWEQPFITRRQYFNREAFLPAHLQ
eukprot:jgi/Botrbrau1/8981/Bobra.0148s0087.1